MNLETFSTLHFLPDPIPGDEGHFADVYGQCTGKESLLATKKGSQKKYWFLSKLATRWAVWRMWYVETAVLQAQAKLSGGDRAGKISEWYILHMHNHVYGELELPERLKNVCVKDHKCNDHTEKLYYSCDLETICCWCVQPDNVSDDLE